MERTFHFSLRRRLRILGPVLAVEAGLLALLAWRGGRDWKSAVVSAVVALLTLRVLSFLWTGRRPVRVSSAAISRGRFSVPLSTASLWVRTAPSRRGLAPSELAVVSPEEGGRRMAVSFDSSLALFEQAAGAVLLEIPDERVRVSAPGEPDVRDARREEVLAPLRPTAADRALAKLGPPALPPPPRR
jgi:hypothetical protein